MLISPAEFDELRQTKLFIESVSRGLKDSDKGEVFSTSQLRKPDGVARGLLGELIRRIEAGGLRVAAAKMILFTMKEAEGFYAVHRERPFFESLTAFMSEGPVMLMVLRGENAILRWRDIMGATDPAKADPGTIRKDFAASIGPWIVTPDELSDCATGRPGVYDLAMIARLNGQERSRGNWRELHYSFGEMIARASASVYLYPGDVIGSGTVGTGCLLELTRGQGPWLQAGDVVELEIERLGILRNIVSRKS